MKESKATTLKNAIQKGLKSPKVKNFDFDKNILKLKSEKRKSS